MEKKFELGDIVKILGEGREAKVIGFKEMKNGSIYVKIEWQDGDNVHEGRVPQDALVKIK